MKFRILGKKDPNIVFLFLSILISLIFLSSMLKYGPVDLENYNCGTIFSALIRAQHLLKGQFLLWYDGIGFGTPFPITPLIELHPFFILSLFLSMKIVRLLFWIIHLSAGSFFFMKLCRLLSLSRLMSIISGFLYVFSLPTINYAITDDFVSPFVGWTMFPIIVFFIYNFFLQNKRKFNYLIFLLPVIFAFTIYNAPTVLNSWIILFFCILLIFLYHPKKYKFKQLLTVFILTCILVAPRYYYILNESRFFPGDLAFRAGDPFTFKYLLSNEFIPFNIDLFRSIANNSFPSWWSNAIDSLKYHDAARTSFTGFVYFILAFTGVAILWRYLRGKSEQILDAVKASAVLGFLLSLIFSLLPKSFFLNTIHPWQFRDQTIFFGIIVAGIQLQRLKVGIFKNYKIIIPLLIIIQITHVLAYTKYLVFNYPSEMHKWNYFKSPQKDSRLLNWFMYYKQANKKRILLSPRIEYEFENPKKELISEGFYAMSDLNLHAGLNPVNGIFKGVSMDRICPSSEFSAGLIKSNYDLLKNSALLDIAGINFILMHESELGKSDFLRNLWPNGIKAEVDTSQNKFRGKSVLFEGIGGPIQLFKKKDWAFGSGDFTVDFWVKFTNISGNQVLVGYPYYSPRKAWQIAWEKEFESLKFSYSTDGSDNTDARFPWSASADTWYHIALVRDESDLKAFVNGTQIGSKHHMIDVSIHDSKDPLYIGSRGTEEHFNGWLAEICISKGIARWTSNFIPPSNEGLTNLHTKSLLHCNGTEEFYTCFHFKNTHVWYLLQNKDAWPKAFFISEKALNSNIKYRPECGHKRFLCADLDESLSYREGGNVVIKGDNGSYELDFPHKKEASVIGLSKLYRPEWKAFANGERLEIKPLFNAFIAIKVPPGVSQISLEFRQPLRILLLYLSLITFVSCLLLTCIFLFKQSKCSKDYS